MTHPYIPFDGHACGRDLNAYLMLFTISLEPQKRSLRVILTNAAGAVGHQNATTNESIPKDGVKGFGWRRMIEKF
eukprot:SAG31_NODE_21747_length_541_cov_1.748869_1_plen_75_part_00